MFIKVINSKHTGEVRNGILNLLKRFKNKVLRNQKLQSHTHDSEPVGLPDDFDINSSIPTVAEALKRVHLSMDISRGFSGFKTRIMIKPVSGFQNPKPVFTKNAYGFLKPVCVQY